MGAFFASRPRARPVGALAFFLLVPHWKDFLPTDDANYRVIIRSPSPKDLEYEPNEPNTMNL